MPADIIGDQAAYLQPEMKVTLSVHEGVPVSIELPQKAILEVVETEPSVKGPDRRLLLQAGGAVERRAHHGAALRRYRHEDRGHDCRRLLCGARQGLSVNFCRSGSKIREPICNTAKRFSLTHLARITAAAILSSCPDVAATAPAR